MKVADHEAETCRSMSSLHEDKTIWFTHAGQLLVDLAGELYFRKPGLLHLAHVQLTMTHESEMLSWLQRWSRQNKTLTTVWAWSCSRYCVSPQKSCSDVLISVEYLSPVQTDSFPVSQTDRGVPQGSFRVPFLFSIFVPFPYKSSRSPLLLSLWRLDHFWLIIKKKIKLDSLVLLAVFWRLYLSSRHTSTDLIGCWYSWDELKHMQSLCEFPEQPCSKSRTRCVGNPQIASWLN